MRKIRITCPSSQGKVWFDYFINQYFYVLDRLSIDGCYIISQAGIKRVHKELANFKMYPKLYVSPFNCEIVTVHNTRGTRQVRKL
jgi:hypothetical protein